MIVILKQTHTYNDSDYDMSFRQSFPCLDRTSASYISEANSSDNHESPLQLDRENKVIDIYPASLVIIHRHRSHLIIFHQTVLGISVTATATLNLFLLLRFCTSLDCYIYHCNSAPLVKVDEIEKKTPEIDE